MVYGAKQEKRGSVKEIGRGKLAVPGGTKVGPLFDLPKNKLHLISLKKNGVSEGT